MNRFRLPTIEEPRQPSPHGSAHNPSIKNQRVLALRLANPQVAVDHPAVTQPSTVSPALIDPALSAVFKANSEPDNDEAPGGPAANP